MKRSQQAASLPDLPSITTGLAVSLHSEFARFIDQHQPLNFVGFEADGHRLSDSGQHSRIVKLSDQGPVEPQPVFDGSGFQIDDLQSALRIGIATGELVVQVESMKRDVSRLR